LIDKASEHCSRHDRASSAAVLPVHNVTPGRRAGPDAGVPSGEDLQVERAIEAGRRRGNIY
jgi:hypothetical protein